MRDRYTISRKLTGGWYLREAGEIVATFPLESKARAAAYAVNLYDSGAYGALEQRVADLRADLGLVRESLEDTLRELRAAEADERPTVAKAEPVLRAVEGKLDELRVSAEGLRGIADDLEHDGQAHAALETRSEADALVEEADNLRAEAGLA